MKYRLVQCVEGSLMVTELTEANLLSAFEVRGFSYVGLEENSRRRDELIGQPRFAGLYDPMWDGDAIRYEDRETYRRLSA